jgi:hypothetical protein
VPCFGTAYSKGVTSAFFGSAHSERVDPSTTLRASGRQFKVERERIKEGATPGVLRKSAEATDAKRVGGMLFFEECGRV